MFWKNKSADGSKAKLARTTALAGAVVAAMAGMSGQAAAQDATGAPAASSDEDIVITGTRIRGVTNANSPSPISVTDAEEISLTRAIALEDVLQRMVGPDTTGGTTVNSNNGAVGVSSIGMRNLGPTRTLVLVDGQRLVPIFFGAASVPDLNTVPVSMVDRIEVLRDGASSIYGADAIGGVINIITNRSFEGLRIDGSAGTSQEQDGDTWSLAATLGMNMDRGNVTVSISGDHQGSVDGEDREWATAMHLGTAHEGGSTYRNQLNILQDETGGGTATVWANGVATTINDPTLGNGSIPCLNYFPGAGRVKLNSNCDLGWNDLAGTLDRRQISANAHYDITPNTTFIAQAFFTDRTSGQSLRPEPLLGDQISTVINGVPIYAGLYVPRSWPGMAVGGNTQTCADPTGCILAFLTPNQFGPRTYRQESESYRIRLGLEGTVWNDYNWEFGYVDQNNQTTAQVGNTGQFNHLAQITGQLPCVNVPGGCVFDPAFGYNVPIVKPNFANGPNMFTPEQVAYLTFTAMDVNRSSQNYFYADIGGPLFQLPAGAVRFSLGAEHRQEHLEDRPDPVNIEGYGPSPGNVTSGGYDVDSLYGELNIPLLSDIPLFQSLTLTPSYRYDSYSTFGEANTWKVGLDWRLMDDIRFRGAYNTGFRAPTTAELFGGQAISFITASGDPCDERPNVNGNSNSGQGLRTAGSTCANAINGGAAYATFNPAQNSISNNQIPLLVGGNPNLQPEESESWTVGVNLTPRFTPGLSFTADYYEITIDNAILTGGIAQSAGPDLVLLGCYGADQNVNFCNLITRNGIGSITQILSLNDNFGTAFVRGLDMELSWDSGQAGLDMPFGGSLNIMIEASKQLENTQSNPDGSVTQFNGFFNAANESNQPELRGSVNVNYTMDPFTFHWDSRYTQGTDDIGGASSVAGEFLPDYWIHDASIAFDLGERGVMSSGRLTFGVNNVFNEDPPYLATDSICKCNSLAGPYDFLGRYFFTRVSASF